MISIIGGQYRSRNILTPDEGTVPTKSIVREAVMSAVTDLINGAEVLDLFAGSGALGLEALSRGAGQAVFCDSSSLAIQTIKKNLSLLQETHATVIHGDFLAAIGQLKGQGHHFSIIFIDPPYANRDYYDQAVSAIRAAGLLAERSAFILEFEGKPPTISSSFGFTRLYHYGKTNVMILRRPL